MSMKMDNSWWSLDDLRQFVNSQEKLDLSEAIKTQVDYCRTYLDKEIVEREEPVYGINTGFGSLCNTSIAPDSLEQLQTNLVRSHACGFGDRVPNDIVRLMLLLKVRGLSYGNSGVAYETIDRLMYLYNQDIYPEIFEQGSLGASGDLSPLSHMALALLGEGNADFNGNTRPVESIYAELGLKGLLLKSKEGLALLNGTQFMSAYGVWCTMKSEELMLWADLLAAMSLEAFDGRPEPFTPQVHEVRGHTGQLKTAENMRRYLDGSDIIQAKKEHVQDPYSFRCVPQVHGASKDALAYVRSVFEREINSVTDNPTIFPDEDLIISAGNFHGQPLALALDFLAISMAEIGSISERRVYKLLAGERGLPAFLVAEPGLNSGYMIPQYTAASIVSQNKQLCTPASVDTIDSSNGQEDHVSMGANAATKAYRVVNNVEKILAIELLNAAQALEFRRPAKSSEIIEKLHAAFRQEVSFMQNDRYQHADMDRALKFIQTFDIRSFLD